MGGGNWNNDFYEERAKVRAATKAPVFKHHEDVVAGKASALHERLDPSKLKNGVREARDSKEHPNSRPVLFGLDVTGSMREVPGIVQSKLGKLMTTILTGGYLPDPQVLFAAVGDSHSDRVPLQVGQFESGLEMEDDLTHMYIEGGGGGGEPREGYEMLFYFAARHTVSDAWDKRKTKGYLFIAGDEHAYATVEPAITHRIFGGEHPSGGEAISTEAIVKEALERYHCYFIIPEGTIHAAEKGLHDYWAKLLGGDHVLHLTDPTQICDLVALTIGLNEGTAKPGSIETLTPAIKAAVDPVLASTKKAVADAKKTGAKTARL